MQLYDKGGRKYAARKARRPKFSAHRGRTWDYETKAVDGTEIKFHFDTSWGFRFYFQWNGEWYVMHHWKGNEGEADALDVAEFFTSKPEVA